MVSLRGAPISLPTFATVGFSKFFHLGRALRCHLPISGGRIVHLVVVYGFQGASTDLEKLRLTEKLLDAVLCELAVVASGQPCLIVGDLNIEPDRIPCLLKCLTAGHWFDLQSSWASASGVAPLLTCCRTFGSGGGSRRDFILGCPHAVSALKWCSVLQDRWILPHFAFRPSFSMGRWSAGACLPVMFCVLWPAAWVAYADKSRSSKSVEVRRIWEVYDESLSLVHPAFWEGIRSSLLAGDVSSAWRIWSFSLRFRQFVPLLVLVALELHSSSVSLSVVLWLVGFALTLGLGMVRLFIFFFKDSSVSRVIILRRRLGCVLSVLDGIFRGGLTLSRDLELAAQWGAVVSAGPCRPLCRANLDVSPAVGLSFFGDHVRVLYDIVVVFLHKVVVSRKIQFISRVWDIPVVLQRQVRPVPNCAEDRRFARCSSWEDVDAPVVVQRQCYGSDSAENSVRAAAAVHRRGVDPL